MKIADKIKQIIDDQQRKGISKYGIGVDEANLSAEKWIMHAQEELADCMVYLESLKRNLRVGKIEVNVLKEAVVLIRETSKDTFFVRTSDIDAYRIGIDHACEILNNMIDDTNV